MKRDFFGVGSVYNIFSFKMMYVLADLILLKGLVKYYYDKFFSSLDIFRKPYLLIVSSPPGCRGAGDVQKLFIRGEGGIFGQQVYW